MQRGIASRFWAALMAFTLVFTGVATLVAPMSLVAPGNFAAAPAPAFAIVAPSAMARSHVETAHAALCSCLSCSGGASCCCKPSGENALSLRAACDDGAPLASAPALPIASLFSSRLVVAFSVEQILPRPTTAFSGVAIARPASPLAPPPRNLS